MFFIDSVLQPYGMTKKKKVIEILIKNGYNFFDMTNNNFKPIIFVKWWLFYCVFFVCT